MSQQMPLSAEIGVWALECSEIELTDFHAYLQGHCLFFSRFRFCQAVFKFNRRNWHEFAPIHVTEVEKS